MREIVILSKDPQRTAELQTLVEKLFPECKTLVLDTVKEKHEFKGGSHNGKYSY